MRWILITAVFLVGCGGEAWECMSESEWGASWDELGHPWEAPRRAAGCPAETVPRCTPPDSFSEVRQSPDLTASVGACGFMVCEGWDADSRWGADHMECMDSYPVCSLTVDGFNAGCISFDTTLTPTCPDGTVMACENAGDGYRLSVTCDGDPSLVACD
jgi:hypothetical protein